MTSLSLAFCRAMWAPQPGDLVSVEAKEGKFKQDTVVKSHPLGLPKCFLDKLGDWYFILDLYYHPKQEIYEGYLAQLHRAFIWLEPSGKGLYKANIKCNKGSVIAVGTAAEILDQVLLLRGVASEVNRVVNELQDPRTLPKP